MEIFNRLAAGADYVSTQFSALVDDPDRALLLAKLFGASMGSVISVAYVLPRGRREAFLRFTVGLMTGLVFGSTVGLKLTEMLGLLDQLNAVEVTVMGAGFASLCAWWALGALKRAAERWPGTVSDPLKTPDRKDQRP